MEESLLTSPLFLWIAGSLFGLLLLFMFVLFMMSRSQTFTRPYAVGCKGEACDVYRERRSGFLRAFDFMFKTRAYSCQSCRKRFIRFKPPQESSPKHSARHQTAGSRNS